MLKFFALKQHIEGLRLFAPERIDAAIFNGGIDWSGSTAGADLLLLRMTYEADIELDGAAGDLRILLAQVGLWLDANGGDPERNRLLEFTGEPVDKHRSDITLRLAFEEDVRDVPAEPGYTGPDKLTWQGTDWKLGDATADLATTLSSMEVTL